MEPVQPIDNYRQVVGSLIERLDEESWERVAQRSGATYVAASSTLALKMFGRDYEVTPTGVTCDGEEAPSAPSIVAVNYLLSPGGEAPGDEWESFAQLPGSMAYRGAFVQNVEERLAKYADYIVEKKSKVLAALDGTQLPEVAGSNLTVKFHALPMVYLLALVYEADEEFPAGAKVLFSENGHHYLPTECAADLAEHMVSRIIETVAEA